jgi:hypothetical protein
LEICADEKLNERLFGDGEEVLRKSEPSFLRAVYASHPAKGEEQIRASPPTGAYGFNSFGGGKIR